MPRKKTLVSVGQSPPPTNPLDAVAVYGHVRAGIREIGVRETVEAVYAALHATILLQDRPEQDLALSRAVMNAIAVALSVP